MWVCDFWARLTIVGTGGCNQSGTCCRHPPRYSHSAECTVLLTEIKQNNLLLKLNYIKVLLPKVAEQNDRCILLSQKKCVTTVLYKSRTFYYNS